MIVIVSVVFRWCSSGVLQVSLIAASVGANLLIDMVVTDSKECPKFRLLSDAQPVHSTSSFTCVDCYRSVVFLNMQNHMVTMAIAPRIL